MRSGLEAGKIEIDGASMLFDEEWLQHTEFGAPQYIPGWGTREASIGMPYTEFLTIPIDFTYETEAFGLLPKDEQYLAEMLHIHHIACHFPVPVVAERDAPPQKR